jgi:hypothetical protein
MDRLLVLIHVPAGVIAVVAGAAAMIAVKGGRAHRRWGLTYLSVLAVVGLSGIGLAITRWPRFPHLIALGVSAALLAAGGYATRFRRSPAIHLICMSTSYVVMLTAFYVDNGPKLPLWRLLPPVTFWFLPSLVALPLLVRAFRRHVRRPLSPRPSA